MVMERRFRRVFYALFNNAFMTQLGWPVGVELASEDALPSCPEHPH